MNKFLLILLIFLLTLTVGQGQTNVYHPFPEDSASWVINRWNNICGNYCDSKVFTMNGDTVINSYSYNKIYIQTLYFYIISYPPNLEVGTSNITSKQYWACIRQDTVNKKVFVLTPSMTKDTILFDFDLKLGDTLSPSYLHDQQDTTVVSSIDSILIGTEYHKRFNFSKPNSYIWVVSFIEGVGSNAGIDQIYEAFEGGFTLTCFNGNIINYEEVYGQCGVNAMTIGVSENESFNKIKIFPNPCNTETTIFTDCYLNNATLTICNLLGQQVKQIRNISGQTFTLRRDNLSSGLYFLLLTQDSKKLITDKLIITDN